MERLQQLDFFPAPDADARCIPLAHAIEREDRRLLEWRREKRRGRVGFVVPCEGDAFAKSAAERASDFFWKMEFRFQPKRHRPQKRPHAERCTREGGLQQAIKFPQRLVVKNHMIHLARRDARFL